MKWMLLILLCAPMACQVTPPQFMFTGTVGAGGPFPESVTGTISFTDANHTMVYPETAAKFIKLTSTATLTAQRDLIAPLAMGFRFTIQNGTQTPIRVIASSGTGVVILPGQTVEVQCDGTNYILPAVSSAQTFFNLGYGTAPTNYQMARSTACGSFLVLSNPSQNNDCHSTVGSLSSPGIDVSGIPSLYHLYDSISKVTSRSISNIFLTTQSDFHREDSILDYGYHNIRSEVYAYNSEGSGELARNQTESPPPSGTIVTGGAGAQMVKTNFTVNSGNQGDVGLLISTSEIADSGLITSSTAGTGTNLNSVTVSTTHTASTAYGTLTYGCGTNLPRKQTSPAICSINVESGTFTATPPSGKPYALVCIGDWHQFEKAKVDSVTALSGGVQSITIELSYLHGSGYRVYQGGGGCGNYLVPGNGSATPLAVFNGTAGSGSYTAAAIAGSRTATTYDYVLTYKNGQNGQIQLSVNNPPSSNISGLTGTSGTVTGTYVGGMGQPYALNGLVVPSAACLSVTGSGNASLNGCVSNFTYNDSNNAITYTLAGASGVSTSTATIQLTGMNSFVSPCGGEVAAVGNPTPLQPDSGNGTSGHPEGDGSLYVEANSCNWPVGQIAANPNAYAAEFFLDKMTSVANTPPPAGANTPTFRSVTGAAWTNAAVFEARTADQLNAYSGYGGTIAGHVAFHAANYVQSGLSLDHAPLQGGCVLCVGPLVSGPWSFYNLFNSFGGSFGGRLSVFPNNSSFVSRLIDWDFSNTNSVEVPTVVNTDSSTKSASTAFVKSVVSGFTGTKTIGSCTVTVANGLIQNITGC